MTSLPSYIPTEQWQEWLKMRKGLKKYPTDYAQGLAIKKLSGWYFEGHDIKAIMEASILNSWLGFFLTKEAEHRKKPDRNWYNHKINAIPKCNGTTLSPEQKKRTKVYKMKLFALGKTKGITGKERKRLLGVIVKEYEGGG